MIREVRKGLNKVSLELVGSLVNMLGPLHHRSKSGFWLEDNHRSKTKRYEFVPYGIFDKVEVIEFADLF